MNENVFFYKNVYFSYVWKLMGHSVYICIASSLLRDILTTSLCYHSNCQNSIVYPGNIMAF